MKLEEMTIDEAIALACREAPECLSQRDSWWMTMESVPLKLRHALWFDAAWEALEKHNHEAGRGAFLTYEAGRYGAQAFRGGPGLGRTYSFPIRTYTTKYHGLAASWLLAKGKPVP